MGGFVFSISFNLLIRDLCILSCQFKILCLVWYHSPLRYGHDYKAPRLALCTQTECILGLNTFLFLQTSKSTVRMERRTVLPRSRVIQAYPGLHIKHPTATFLVCNPTKSPFDWWIWEVMLFSHGVLEMAASFSSLCAFRNVRQCLLFK